MRVIGGAARGRRLVAPQGRDVRPTADRVREALFSALADELPGAVVLDLFAGSGALGVEALSRGAAAATFVERDAKAAAAVERNVRTAGVEDRAALRRTDAARFARAPAARAPYTLVFCDPPYSLPLREVFDLLAALHRAGSLAPDATVVVERDKRDPDLDVAPPRFLAFERRRSYGDTVLLTYSAATS